VEIIDLSQAIYEGMPVYKSLPQVKITMSNSHEEWEGIENPVNPTPSVYKLEMGEHTGTHVDAINHMDKQYKEESIDTMPLSMFYTEGICLDFRRKDLQELITIEDVKDQLLESNQEIKQGDTVLFCTGHYKKHFETENWSKGPGITTNLATWLGRQKIAAFGVETMSPGVPGISNKEVHKICGELKFTHYENMVNLESLLGKGRFRFIALPLKIKGGTGSPVRAVAVFE
jgi:kynurenine formamidase